MHFYDDKLLNSFIKLLSTMRASPWVSSPRITRLSPGSIPKIYLALAVITICPLSPTFTRPNMYFPLGGIPSPDACLS